MKLLLDENISRRIVPDLNQLFPGTSHVSLLDLERYSDQAIWEYAKGHDFVIVSKDHDFIDLQSLYGFPPKLIILLLGNSSNDDVLKALQASSSEIITAIADVETGYIEIY